MKKFFAIATGLLILAACSKEPQSQVTPTPGTAPEFTPTAIRIAPVMTKVTETAFENGDAIGLTVTRGADGAVAPSAWASNKKLTFNGLEFTSDLLWYPEGTDEATLAAYYPYIAEGVPATFTVATDQADGIQDSDFIAAVKTGVLPTANAVTMPFKHKLSRLVVAITNNAGYTIEGLTLKGIIPTAALAEDFTATVSPDDQPADITAFKVDETTYTAIVPPQTVAITAEVSAAGKALSQKLAESTLAAGKKYTINVIVNQEDIEIVLSGDIEDWTDGGALQPDNSGTPAPEIQFEENLEENYFTYDNVRYNVVKLDDGKWWMAQNLAFVPAGITPATELSAVTAGVFAPIQLNAEGSAVEFTTSADVIAAKGYLYQSEVALGLKVGDLTSVEQAEALEGAQGICPTGWHIPTIADITGLVGKAVSPIETNASAPYYDGSNGSIAMLNAAGFNLQADGAISIASNVATVGTFMGKMNNYDHLCSSMMIGSSYAGVTYNTTGDETSGIKNLQFWGLMPMTNKTSEDQYTCNGTKVSYRIAGPVRCVRDE